MPFDTDPALAPALTADAGEFTRQLWAHLRAHGGWHAHVCTALEPLAQALIRTSPADLLAPDHPWQALTEQLHALLLGYHPELGRSGERLLKDVAGSLRNHLNADADDWQQALSAVAALAAVEQTRLQRIEQRLVDTAHGQWRSQRARQQAAQLLNRSMAGKQLAPDIVDWLQGEWFNELQWCLLHHGDTGSAWQRRADVTLALVASLQPPGDDLAARQALYTQIPAVTADLRALLGERAHSSNALDETLALIEHQHLLLLKGRKPDTRPFKLISTDNLWFADISLSRELLVRIEELATGQWFLLREDCDRRVKLILNQQEVGELLFVNQVGIKALQVSTEEFAYRLAADVALPLPGAGFYREALALAEQAAQAGTAEQARAEEQAALQKRREEVRQRIETEARQRALARTKAAAEARALAEEQARAVAAATQLAAEETQRLREQELARRRQVQAQLAGDEARRQRLARQQAAMLGIGQWLELHDETGHLQHLKLAVKLPTTGKLIFVDREGIRRADFSRDQLIAHLLDGSARIDAQGPQFDDTLARVVDGLRRDRSPGRDA